MFDYFLMWEEKKEGKKILTWTIKNDGKLNVIFSNIKRSQNYVITTCNTLLGLSLYI